MSPSGTTVVCVAASERTWHNLERYCFNSAFSAQRRNVALAIGFNGYDPDAFRYLSRFEPEYLYPRPNTGHDLANFDNILKRLPAFDRYIFLHDDHWFYDPSWLPVLGALAADHPEIDAWGNLVAFDVAGEFREYYVHLARALGYHELAEQRFAHFLQGLAGVYSRRAIDLLLALDGIPHLHRSVQIGAQVCERLFSGLLLDRGLMFGQIPPGFELYLLHRDHSIVKHKLDEAAALLAAGEPARAQEIFGLLRQLRPDDTELQGRIARLTR